MEKKSKRDVEYFLIIYITFELILILGFFYYGICGQPSHEWLLNEMFFYLALGFGILAPIVFFVMRVYNKKRKVV